MDIGCLCLPAAEEIGLMFRDKVRYWRLNNIIKIIQKSGDKLNFENEKLQLTAHPKVVNEIIENGSWSDDETIQEMWAGLLVSSCNKENGDDSNLLFTNVLKQLTTNQAKLINYLCIRCKMTVDKHGFIMAQHVELSVEQLKELFKSDDIYKIDTELDYLRSIELLSDSSFVHGAGFSFGRDRLVAELEPSPFAISMYVKAQGYPNSPKEFYQLEHVEPTNK